MTVTHLNPEQLHVSPFFSQGVVAETGRTLYVGGQNGTDGEGVIDGDLAQQTAQALRNVLAVLGAAEVGPEQVVKLTVHLYAEADPQVGFGVAQQVWGSHPTAITVLRVVGFARPEALVEIDAVAALPWRGAPRSPSAVS